MRQLENLSFKGVVFPKITTNKCNKGYIYFFEMPKQEKAVTYIVPYVYPYQWHLSHL